MDGTITEPLLDFPRIRADIGITPGRPILEALAEMNAADRAQAEAILLRHERDAAERATINAGCDEVMAELRRRGVPTAWITRNCRACVEIVLARHPSLRPDLTLSREDTLPKPHPEPVYAALRRLGVHRVGGAAGAWMVGDGEHDVQAGNAAGVSTVWLSHGKPRKFAAEPVATIASMRDLLPLLTAAAR